MYQVRRSLHQFPLELGGQRYNCWKHEVLDMERHILKELGFSLYTIMDHPHRYILYYVKLLHGTPKLSQVAWNFLNDSLRLDLNLRFHSHEITCAAIYLAARKEGFALPLEPEPWWSLMTRDFDNITVIAEHILSLYEIKKVSLFFKSNLF